MTDSDLPVNSSDQQQPAKAKSRWKRTIGCIKYLLLAAMVVVFGFEFLAMRDQGRSIVRLKEFAKGLGENASIAPAEIEKRLIGWVRQRETRHQQSRVLVYTWPSLLQVHQVRVRLGRDGHVFFVDAEPNDQEDFMQPFIVVNLDGVTVKDQPRRRLGMQPDTSTPIDHLALLREAFSAPRMALKPGILIFPVTDSEGIITPTGAAISMTAQHTVVSTPTKRMALDPRWTCRTLVQSGTWRGGTKIDPGRIQLCLKTIGAAHYVLPKLEAIAGRQQLSMALMGTPHPVPPRFVHDVTDIPVPEWPGLIALSLLDHLKEVLIPEERAWAARPQFRSTVDAEKFVQDAEAAGYEFFAKASFHAQLIEPNLGWVAAWDLYCDCIDDRNIGGKIRFKSEEVQKFATIARDCPKLTGQSDAFCELLKMTPMLRGEALFHDHLLYLACEFSDKRLASEVLSIWEREDGSYASRLRRATTLLDLAESSRSAGLSGRNRKPFPFDPLEKAEQDLKLAVQFHPKGWAAYAELFRCAWYQNHPEKECRKYFEHAIQLMPRFREVFRYRLAMLIEVDGSYVPELYELADLCLANGHWEQSIPQMVPVILSCITYRPQWGAEDFQVVLTSDYWQRVASYYRQAMEQPDQKIQSEAVNFFAANAARTGHFAEALPAFIRLDRQVVLPDETGGIKFPPRIKTEWDVEQFGSAQRYFEFRDKVFAHTRSDVPGLLAKVRLALLESRFSDAQKQLDELRPESEEDQREASRLRYATTFGERLKKEKRVQITANEALELFAEVNRLSCRGIKGNQLWSVQDIKLVYNQPEYSQENGWIEQSWIYFPVGIQHAIIRGKLNCDANFSELGFLGRVQSATPATKMAYSLSNNQLVVSRAGRSIQVVNLTVKRPFPFEIRFGVTEDQYSGIPGQYWTVPVIFDAPYTFGLQIWRSGQLPNKFELSELSIEYHK